MTLISYLHCTISLSLPDVPFFEDIAVVIVTKDPIVERV